MSTNITEIAVEGDILELKNRIKTGESLPKGILQTVIFSGWHQGENIEILELLLEAGADINGLEGDFNCTPLHTAAMVGSFPDRSVAVTDFLLKKGANPNIKNKNGETPIFEAVNKVSDQTVKRLIDGGADINIKNKNGTPLLHICLLAYKGFLQANLDEIFDPVTKEYVVKNMDHLLQAKPDFTLTNEKKTTVIQECLLHRIFLEKKFTEIILKKLIQHGCPTDVIHRYEDDDKDLSLFAIAITTNPIHSFEVINTLADVNDLLKNELGTPNISELMYYSPTIGIEILRSRPHLFKTEHLGNTLLHYVLESESRSIDLIEILIENGVDPNRVNNQGKTALDLAVEMNIDEAIIASLRKHQK